MGSDNGEMAPAFSGASSPPKKQEELMPKELLPKALLDDAPLGHEAWEKVRKTNWASSGATSCMYLFTTKDKVKFQTTLKACHWDEEHAWRIARLCYVKMMSEGWTKAETVSYRNALYDEVKAAQDSGALPLPAGAPGGGSAGSPSLGNHLDKESQLASPAEPHPEPNPASPMPSNGGVNTETPEDLSKVIEALTQIFQTDSNKLVGPYHTAVANAKPLVEGLPESQAKRRCLLCMRAQARHLYAKNLSSWRPYCALAIQALDPALAEGLWPKIFTKAGLIEIPLAERMAPFEQLVIAEESLPDDPFVRAPKSLKRKLSEEEAPNLDERKESKVKQEQEEGVPMEKKKATKKMKREQDQGVTKDEKDTAAEMKQEQEQDAPKKDKTRASVKQTMELLRKEGRLEGAVQITGRNPGKKNSSINGIYAPLVDGYGGSHAFQLQPSESLQRFLLFSSSKKRWQISEELQEGKGRFAYVKADDGQDPPVDLATGVHWKVFDGQGEGYNEDPTVVCSLLPSKPKASKPKTLVTKPSNTQTENSSGSSSSSSSSDSESGGENLVKASRETSVANLPMANPGPIPLVCGKMLVNVGLRCVCHFAYVRDCPQRNRNLL